MQHLATLVFHTQTWELTLTGDQFVVCQYVPWPWMATSPVRCNRLQLTSEQNKHHGKSLTGLFHQRWKICKLVRLFVGHRSAARSVSPPSLFIFLLLFFFFLGLFGVQHHRRHCQHDPLSAQLAFHNNVTKMRPIKYNYFASWLVAWDLTWFLGAIQ